MHCSLESSDNEVRLVVRKVGRKKDLSIDKYVLSTFDSVPEALRGGGIVWRSVKGV